jgi:hypothetical protein
VSEAVDIVEHMFEHGEMPAAVAYPLDEADDCPEPDYERDPEPDDEAAFSPAYGSGSRSPRPSAAPTSRPGDRSPRRPGPMASISPAGRSSRVPEDRVPHSPDAYSSDDDGRGARGPDARGSDARGSVGPAVRAETVDELQARIRQMQGTRLDTRDLPTHPAIGALLPGGGLKQGAAYSVEHSVTLLMALLAGPSAAGSWCGVIGVPEFGVEAAAQYGIDLDRLVLVPHPGDQWLSVTAAIADVVTVVVTRPPRRAADSSVARLAARLRQRGSTLIVLGTWPQTDAMLSLSESRWSGIGHGHGHLAAREVTVTVSTRAGSPPQSARLWLPDRAAGFSSVSAVPELPASLPGLDDGTTIRFPHRQRQELAG